MYEGEIKRNASAFHVKVNRSSLPCCGSSFYDPTTERWTESKTGDELCFLKQNQQNICNLNAKLYRFLANSFFIFIKRNKCEISISIYTLQP